MDRFRLPAALFHELQCVEDIINERLDERPTVRRLIAQYAFAGAAGRLLASLTLLTAQLGSYNPEAAQHSAAAIWLIDIATRIHETLIDPAERRRGTVSSDDWDGSIGLMAGDYVFALAASEMALAPDPRIIAFFSHAVMRVSEAQLAPVVALVPAGQAIEQYYSYITNRTAALFGAATQAGGVCGQLAASAVETLGRFGHQLGLAYQLEADARNFLDDRQRMYPGAITLPLIYAAESGNSELLARALDGEPTATALDTIRASGGIEHALADARAHGSRALAELAGLPDSPLANN